MYGVSLVFTDEHRDKISKALKRHKRTEEHKRNMSISKKRYYTKLKEGKD